MSERICTDIILTNEVLARYKISRSTLTFWSTPKRMPKFLSKPFPHPTINGCPKRWRMADILAWEDEVGINPGESLST